MNDIPQGGPENTPDAQSNGPASPVASVPPPKQDRSPQLAPYRFRKGQSGNPSGVPSFMRTIHLQFRDKIPMLLNRLYLLAMKNDGPVGVMAAREFMDRTVGKAPQTIVERAAEPLPTDIWGEIPEAKLDEIIKATGALPDDVEAEMLATPHERATG